MSKTTGKGSMQGSAKGVLILECLDQTDPGSEGRFLSHMFNIMGVASQYLEIRTKQQFIAMLQANPFDVLHITTHGNVSAKDEFKGFWTPKGVVPLDDFPEDILHGKLVVSTACLSGKKKFGKPFVKRVSAKYYIAPDGSPWFHNAIYFAHWFYHNVLVLNLTPPEAMKKYNKGYKNPHDFSLFK